MRRLFCAISVFLLAVGVVEACSMCRLAANSSTLRQEALQAKHVYVGTLSNPRITGTNPTSIANSSATDFTIKQVIKSDPARKTSQQFTIPRYVQVDPKSGSQYLVFCDIDKDGRLDVYRDQAVSSPALINYLKAAMEIDPKDANKLLGLAGKHLADADAELQTEAYMEFAKAADADVLRVAKTLPPQGLRKLIDDPKTPADRLALFVTMLGACGQAEDAARFRALVANPGDRFHTALAGIYAGFILLQPTDGWSTIQMILADAKRNFADRNAALNALRFFYNANPVAVRDQALKAMKSLVTQEDIADYAFDDLRRWQLWDLTPQILANHGRKGFDAPLMKRAIVRYALCCPTPEAKAFIVAERAVRPDLVKEVEDALEYEKLPAKPYNKDNR